jgi:hypothetical protein
MSKTFIIALAILTAGAISTLPVQAGTKAGTSAPVDELPSSQVAPLTKKECTNLGGTVKNDKVCKSGKTCRMDSANGDQHFVCLEAAS